MRNVSSAFMRALAEDKRDWICTATITLVQNIYSYPKVKKNMRYRISGTYSSVSLGGVAITVTEGYFTAPDDGVLTITGGTSSGDAPTVIRQILDIDNSHIWENGFKIEDAVSADNLFEIGGAIINQATLVLNNIYDEFTEYDFFGANVVVYVGLEVGDVIERVKMGTFLVDEAKYNSSLLTLTCLDYMSLFDKPSHYNGGTYLGTPSAFLQVACERCGVTLATPNFPNKDIEVYATLSGNTSYRQVVSWVAQIAGCYARMNVDGELELDFYDFDALEGITEDGLDGGVFDEGSPYASGDSADGGSFNPWDTTGDTYDGGSFTNMPNVHIISSDYSHNLSMDDIVITGVKVIEKVGDYAFQYAQPYHNNQSYAVGNWCRYNNNLYECISPVTAGTEFDESKWKQLSVIEHTSGSEGYMVVIDGNEMTHGKQTGGALTGQVIANLLGVALIGRTFRQASISHPSDPTIEAGDVALFIDRKGYQYPIVVSSTTFSNGDAQSTTSSAQTPQKNSSQKYSASTKNYVAMREQLSNETAYVEQTINDKIANAGGLYETYTTNVKTGEGMIWHLHDKPNLAESNIVMMFSDVGFTLTSNYQDATPTWYGLTVDGDLIARYLSADGVNAGWIRTGALTVKDANQNETFYADTATGIVRIKATEFSLAGAQITSSWSGDGIPTNSNFPAVNWTTDAIKAQHLDDMYYDENSKTGIYKYSEMYEGLLVRFTGTYNYTGTGESFKIAFKHGTGWYQYINPFENGDVDVSLFIPTHYKNNANQPGFLMFIETGDGGLDCSLTYRITVVNDVFPDATYYGTSEPFSGYNLSTRDINTDYTLYESAASGIRYRTISVNTTPLNLNAFYGWKNIGLSGDDEYARALAQNASNAVSALDSSLDQEEVFNRLTNNGTSQGIHLHNGLLYMSFEFARGGTLKLGDYPNSQIYGSGTLEVYDSTGQMIGSIDENGFMMGYSVDAYGNAGNSLSMNDGVVNFTYGSSTNIGGVGVEEFSWFDDDWPWIGRALNISVPNNFVLRNSHIVTLNSSEEHGMGMELTANGFRLYGDVYTDGGGFYVLKGSKSRVAGTKNYGDRALYSYETPTPYFGDIGTAKTDENGVAVISIDDIFDETINTGIEYSVFLQKEGRGDLWVAEKNCSFFVVEGTPNLKFSWEVKAVQKGFEYLCLDDIALKEDSYNVSDLKEIMNNELAELDRELEVL